MSPSEFELREALRYGESDGADRLDADSLIARAADLRHARRMRMGAVAAAVVAVGAIGGGGSVLLNRSGGHNHPASTYAAGAAQTSAARGTVVTGGTSGTGADGRTAATVPSVTAPSAATAQACPTSPSLAGKTTATATALIAQPVSGLRVCTYPDSGTGQSAVLTGTDAQTVADSLNAASATSTSTFCPLTGGRSGGSALIVPVSASGSPLPAVLVTDRNCSWTLTNGVVTRYNWTVPSVLRGVFAPLNAGGPIAATTSGVNIGTPLH